MYFTAVYIRVSTVRQNEAGQKADIDRWLNGNAVDRNKVRYYIDRESGDTMNRTEFAKLERDIFSGLISTVVVWKLDRLSRKLRDGLNVLCEWCDRNLRIVSVTQQIDFHGVVGKMIAAVLLGIGEMEQEARRERQAVGIASAKQRGVYSGRRKGAIKAGVDPNRARKLREQGLTQSEIAKSLDVSVSSVRRYLKAG
jgi:DNA invertase Pin-like site-specific DNA recombinase